MKKKFLKVLCSASMMLSSGIILSACGEAPPPGGDGDPENYNIAIDYEGFGELHEDQPTNMTNGEEYSFSFTFPQYYKVNGLSIKLGETPIQFKVSTDGNNYMTLAEFNETGYDYEDSSNSIYILVELTGISADSTLVINMEECEKVVRTLEFNSFYVPSENQDWTGSEIVLSSISSGIYSTDDYDITYENNINPGVATVTITGKGEYKGSQSYNFNIIRTLTKDDFSVGGHTLAEISSDYTKLQDELYNSSNPEANKKEVTCLVSGPVAGEDYLVTYNKSGDTVGEMYISISNGSKTEEESFYRLDWEVTQQLSYTIYTTLERSHIYSIETLEEDVTFNGQTQEWNKNVSGNGDVGISSIDVTYPSDMTNCGQKTITVTKNDGYYRGVVTINFNIVPADLSLYTGIFYFERDGITKGKYIYLSDAVVLAPTIEGTCFGIELVENTDFTVSSSLDFTSIGTKEATIHGIGNFTGTTTISLDVIDTFTESDFATLSIPEQEVSESSAEVRVDGVIENFLTGLTLNEDYEVYYESNYYLGKASVTIRGKYNEYDDENTSYYSSDTSVTLYFNIIQNTNKRFKKLSDYTGGSYEENSDGIELRPYTIGGEAPSVAWAYSDVIDRFFNIEFKNYNSVSGDLGLLENSEKPQLIITAKSQSQIDQENPELGITTYYRGSTTIYYEITPYQIDSGDFRYKHNDSDPSDDNKTLDSDEYWTGSAITKSVESKYMSGLDEGNDFDVVFENNVNPGEASVKITGKGNFSGTVTIPFKIIRRLTLSDFYDDVNSVQHELTEDEDWDGDPITKNVVCKVDGLVLGEHYQVVYQNNTDWGRATLKIKTLDNCLYYTTASEYSLVLTYNFDIFRTITKADFNEEELIADENTDQPVYVFSKRVKFLGEEDNSIITCRYDNISDLEHIEESIDPRNQGKYRLTVSGIESKYLKGELIFEYRVVSSITESLILNRETLRQSVTYTGNEITKDVNFNGEDRYNLEYQHNVDPGTAMMIFTGNEDNYWVGRVIIYFDILEPVTPSEEEPVLTSIALIEDRVLFTMSGGVINEDLRSLRLITYSGDRVQEDVMMLTESGATVTFPSSITSGVLSNATISYKGLTCNLPFMAVESLGGVTFRSVDYQGAVVIYSEVGKNPFKSSDYLLYEVSYDDGNDELYYTYVESATTDILNSFDNSVETEGLVSYQLVATHGVVDS